MMLATYLRFHRAGLSSGHSNIARLRDDATNDDYKLSDTKLSCRYSRMVSFLPLPHLAIHEPLSTKIPLVLDKLMASGTAITATQLATLRTSYKCNPECLSCFVHSEE